MVDHTFTLSDGRALGYRVYGSDRGRPVLYFHGTPSSRLELNLLRRFDIDVDGCLAKNNIMLIAIDRPGMGISAFHKKRTFISFADDVYELMQGLQVSLSNVMCWSGGGPYALAMAWRYPSLITNVYILCGFSRRFTSDLIRKMGRNKWYFLVARFLPGLLRLLMNRVRNTRIKRSLPQWLSGLPDPDYGLIKDPIKLEWISTNTLAEACRVDARGAVLDASLYFGNFGFDLSAIHQPVHFWWGTKDNAVIEQHAEYVKKAIPNGNIHYKAGEGHLSLYVRYFEEVIGKISADHLSIT